MDYEAEFMKTVIDLNRLMSEFDEDDFEAVANDPRCRKCAEALMPVFERLLADQ